MILLLLPQYYWFKDWPEVSQETIDRQVFFTMARKFGLLREEVGMSESYFRRAFVEKTSFLNTVHRTIEGYATTKEVWDFCCNYTYANNHSGVFPLDTNDFARLKKIPGRYNYKANEPENNDGTGSEGKEEDTDEAEKAEACLHLIENRLAQVHARRDAEAHSSGEYKKFLEAKAR